MRQNRPESQQIAVAQTEEERLRKEVEDLKRQLEEQKSVLGSTAGAGKMWRPSGVTLWAIFLAATVGIAGAFLAGYIPMQKRQAVIRNEALEREQAVPRVEVIQVGRSSLKSELELPGNIQAITEAPILARADGYIQQRMVDIGDRVKTGQPLAIIEAPEIDQQIRQAKANIEQARAAIEQALANYEQGKSNLELARVTADRWKRLVAQGAVSRQENDQYQTQYQAQESNVQALERAVAAQRSNVAAAEANLARLDEVQSYRVVKAPFDGVITVRNVDVGALVNAGSTMLFRVAQTGTLRIYVNVPQTNASFIRPGLPARLSISNMPGRQFAGTVARTANALDPNSRTMLVEVQVPNAAGALLPGMYAQVNLSSARTEPPLLVPGDALVVRADGTLVAVLSPDHTVHLQKIELGRDYGDRLEVLGGLREGDTILTNPGDMAREGIKVNPVTTEATSYAPNNKGAAKRQ